MEETKNELPEWQVRVIEERDQLKERREKLQAFLEGDQIKTLPYYEVDLLVSQLQLMTHLLVVLNSRIALFSVQS